MLSYFLLSKIIFKTALPRVAHLAGFIQRFALYLIIVFEQLQHVTGGVTRFGKLPEALCQLRRELVGLMVVALVKDVIPGESVIKPDIEDLVTLLEVVSLVPVTFRQQITDGKLPPGV